MKKIHNLEDYDDYLVPLEKIIEKELSFIVGRIYAPDDYFYDYEFGDYAPGDTFDILKYRIFIYPEDEMDETFGTKLAPFGTLIEEAVRRSILQANGFTIKNATIDEIEIYADMISIYFEIVFIETTAEELSLSLEDLLDFDEIMCTRDSIDELKTRAQYFEILTFKFESTEELKTRINKYLMLNADPKVVSILNQASELRTMLKLDQGVWKCMPNDLFTLAWVHHKSVLPKEFYSYVIDKYGGHDDYELFEFLGDSVYELIVRNKLILRNPSKSPGKLSNYSSSVVRNMTLNCMMNSKGLCSKPLTHQKKRFLDNGYTE